MILVPSRILFLSPLAPFFYTFYTWSAFSMVHAPLLLWQYCFMVFYSIIMALGTLLFLATMFFPCLKNQLNTFLYGADMTASFFGEYGRIHSKAFVSFLLLIVGYILYSAYGKHTFVIQPAEKTYTQMQKDLLASCKTKEEVYALTFRFIEEDSLSYRIHQHTSKMKINQVIQKAMQEKDKTMNEVAQVFLDIFTGK